MARMRHGLAAVGRQPRRPVQVVLVDHQLLVRAGLRLLLDQEPAIQVAGEASTAEEALSLLHTVDCDLVVLDLSLPGRGGVWLTSEIHAARPELPILVLAGDDESISTLQALRSGACGHTLKTAQYTDVLTAIMQVHQTGFYLHPGLVRSFLSELRPPRTHAPVDRKLRSALTDRERRVLQMVAAGLGNQGIAHTLKLSESTIKSILRTVFTKLNVDDRVQASVRGLQLGIIRPDQDRVG